MSTGAFGREARWEYTRVYRGSNQSSSSRSRRDFLILNLSSSSSLSSKVGPSETQGSLLEIPTRQGCLVSGEPDRNRKKSPASTILFVPSPTRFGINHDFDDGPGMEAGLSKKSRLAL